MGTDETKSEYIGLRATPTEKAALEAEANNRDLSLSEYLIQCGLHRALPEPLPSLQTREMASQLTQRLFDRQQAGELSHDSLAVVMQDIRQITQSSS